MYRPRGHPDLLARYADVIDRTRSLITHTRHKDFLGQVVMHLEVFIAFYKYIRYASLVHHAYVAPPHSSIHLKSISLRSPYGMQLVRFLLDVGVEEVWGGIFSSFCVGK